MEKSQSQSQLDLIHHTSLKELINPVRDRLPNTFHLLGTLRQFLTTRHFIVKITNDFSSLHVRTDLEGVFEVVSIIIESLCDFLIGGGSLLELLKLLHLASLEELVNDFGRTLTNTLNLLGTLRKLFTTRHLEGESVECITDRAIGVPLVRVLFIRGELVKDVNKFVVVRDEKLRLGLGLRLRLGLGLGLVVRLFENLTLVGGD